MCLLPNRENKRYRLVANTRRLIRLNGLSAIVKKKKMCSPQVRVDTLLVGDKPTRLAIIVYFFFLFVRRHRRRRYFRVSFTSLFRVIHGHYACVVPLNYVCYCFDFVGSLKTLHCEQSKLSETT